MNVCYLRVSGPSASITFYSSGIPERKLLFLGREVGEGETARLALQLDLNILKLGARPVLGPQCLVPWVWEQWTDPPLPSGQMKRGWRCRAGPEAAGGQGAGPCGVSVDRPPGLLAPPTQVCLQRGGRAWHPPGAPAFAPPPTLNSS